MAIYSDLNQFSPQITKPVLTDAEAVYQAVWNVMAVRKGERMFRPRFGTNVHRIIHRLITEGTRLELFRETVEAVTANEPRVDLNTADTEIEPDEFEIGKYNVDLAFNIRGLLIQAFRFQGSLPL